MFFLRKISVQKTSPIGQAIQNTIQHEYDWKFTYDQTDRYSKICTRRSETLEMYELRQHRFCAPPGMPRVRLRVEYSGKTRMSMKQWYESLFEQYGKAYDSENFVQGTLGECDFIEQEIGFNKHLRILDIGCGTGRHSIELTKRGYHVIGVDLSESMLKRAKEKADAFNLTVDFRRHDARNLPFQNEFELAIMLCEGGFPLMETDEMNFAILRSAARSLAPNGKMIFTTLNGLFPLFHSVKEFLASQQTEGDATYRDNTFDLMTFRDHNITTIVNDLGETQELICNERYYVPSEITWLLKSLDFSIVEIFSAKLGAFSRHDALTTDDFEMLVVAKK